MEQIWINNTEISSMINKKETVILLWLVKENIKEQVTIWEVCDMKGEGNGTPLQYSWLENPMDGGAW